MSAQTKTITYKELLENVSILANGLKAVGVKKGDRVCIYMPMILEAAYLNAGLHAIRCSSFCSLWWFFPEAIRSRINDADCRYVITADEGIRGGKRVPLKKNVDIALQGKIQ